MRKNKPDKKKLLYLALSLIFLLALFSLQKQEAKVITKEETVVVLTPTAPSEDLQNSDEGSILITLRASEKDIDIGEKTPTKIQIFRSKTVSGLAIYYMYKDKVINGGLPLMATSEVQLIDGNFHQIAYTFKKDDFQRIYLDGEKLAEGKFEPESTRGITGLAVLKKENTTESDKNVDINFYEKALTEEEIKGLTQ